jgi:type I restriction enzyme S subunit
MARVQVPGWLVAKLWEIAELTMGQSPPSSTYNTDAIGLPFFQGKAEFGETFPVVAKYCSKPLRTAEADDILLSVRAPVGPVNISPSKCCIGRGLCAIRTVQDKVDQWYLFFYLRSIEKWLARLGQGSTFGAIGKKDIEDLKVPHPASLEKQRKIVSVLRKATLLRQKRSQSNAIASKLTQSVFLKMFGDPATNPKGWETATLESVCIDVIDCPHSTPKYLESGVPLVRTPNIRKGYVDFSDSRFISSEEHKERSERIHPQKGDLLYAREATFGNAALVDIDEEFSVGQRIMLLRPNTKLVKSEFLVWMINSDYVYSQASQAARGATNPHVNVADVKQFKIVRPPMELQTRFATIAGRLNALREKQKRSTEEVNRLFQSIVHKAFKGELVLGDAETLNN